MGKRCSVNYDVIIIGAGMYGLYAAIAFLEQEKRVLLADVEAEPFSRGSYINQARLHNGYHYPRSYSTASKSARYFQRYLDSFRDCINADFTQIYAVAKYYSWTNGRQFQRFCDNLSLYCEEIPVGKYFNKNTVDKAFLTNEHAFDAQLIKEKLWQRALKLSCAFALGFAIERIVKETGLFRIVLANGAEYTGKILLNASYAGTNQIHKMLGYDLLPIKYELCEVALCNVSDNIKNIGLTVMDGPFFSVMPFGKSGYHSLTTVSRTPHVTSCDVLPTFACQKRRGDCTPENTQNCNFCPCRPPTAFTEMYQTAKKYLLNGIKIEYVRSLFTLKPIMKASEIDDSRPTIIRQYSENPDFYSVFSGKINTMYDLDQILYARRMIAGEAGAP
jgi:hypothetical protein